jgi:hypothetical protein
VLVAARTVGLGYTLPVTLAIVVLLAVLVTSYRQVIAAVAVIIGGLIRTHPAVPLQSHLPQTAEAVACCFCCAPSPPVARH